MSFLVDLDLNYVVSQVDSGDGKQWLADQEALIAVEREKL